MAKRIRKRPSTHEVLTLNLPRPVWKIIRDSARIAGLTTDQVVSAILAVGLVTRPDKQP